MNKETMELSQGLLTEVQNKLAEIIMELLQHVEPSHGESMATQVDNDAIDYVLPAIARAQRIIIQEATLLNKRLENERESH